MASSYNNPFTNRLSLHGEVSRECPLDDDFCESSLTSVRSGLAGCVHAGSMQLRQLPKQPCLGASWTTEWKAFERGDFGGQGLGGSQGSGSVTLVQHVTISSTPSSTTRSGTAFVVRWSMQLRQVLQPFGCGASWISRITWKHSREVAQEAAVLKEFVLALCKAFRLALRQGGLYARSVGGVSMQLCQKLQHFVAGYLIDHAVKVVC